MLWVKVIHSFILFISNIKQKTKRSPQQEMNQRPPGHLQALRVVPPKKLNKSSPKLFGKSASPPRTFAQLRNKVPTGYNGTPHIHPPKLPLSLRRSTPYLIHPSLDRPHSPLQTASRSNLPFWHGILSGPTDTPTDRHMGLSTGLL